MAAASPAWEDCGGSESEAAVNSFWWVGRNWKSYQKIVSRVRRLSGIDLATAKSYHSSTSLTSTETRFYYNANSYVRDWVDTGTRVTYSYAQISGSNLYELTETHETITASVR